MKIGLCVIDMPPMLGGGYVFRESLAQAALANPGRHQIELVKARPIVPKFEQRSLDASVGEIKRQGRVASILSPAALKTGVRKIALKVLQGAIDSRVQPYVDWAIEQKLTWPNPDVVRVFESDMRQKKFDLLWFNNIEPIHIGVPYVYNLFDLQHRLQPWFPEVSDGNQYRLREGSYSEALRRAAFVITASEEVKAQAIQFYGVPSDRIRVIHFPTPQTAIDAASAENPNVTEAYLRTKFGIEGRFLFYPAQFWAHKNHINLLRGLKILRDQHGLDFSMVFAGADHGNAGFVKAEARALGLTDRVRFAGFVSADEVSALYRHAFALTYVTFFGPCNLPPLEAFALGCPVVLSDIPGIEKLFEDAVVPVNHRDPAAIAAGIKKLVDDPAECARRVAKGKVIAARKSMSNYVAQVQALFDEFESVRCCWP